MSGPWIAEVVAGGHWKPVRPSGGEPYMQYLSGYLATVLDWKRTDQGAIKVSGCGMDMIFHTVYSASWVVWRGTNAPEARPRNGQKKPARCDKGGDAGYVWESGQL